MSDEMSLGSDILHIKRSLCCGDIEELEEGKVLSRLPAESYNRPPPFFLDVAHLAPEKVDYFNLIQRQGLCPGRALRLIQFWDALTVGQGAVVTSSASLIFDSVAEFINHGQTPDGFSGRPEALTLDLRQQQVLSGQTALIKRPWYRNYGHFLVDLLPLLMIWREAGIELDTILFGEVPSGNLYDFMMAAKTATYPDAKVIFSNDSTVYRCESLFYIEPVHVPPLFKHPSAISKARKLSLGIFGAATTKPRGERIYLSRRNTKTRDLENAAEIEGYLKQLGFQTVFPELISITDQISFFENASHIIGSKGAALTNIIFCRPETHILALSSASFVDPFFWDLSSLSHLRYSEIFGKSHHSNPAVANFMIDVSTLEAYAKKVGLA